MIIEICVGMGVIALFWLCKDKREEDKEGFANIQFGER
jgi:hypothetical protein